MITMKYHPFDSLNRDEMSRSIVHQSASLRSCTVVTTYIYLTVNIFRFMKYATKEKKEGRVPFIDPYKMNPCRQIYGEQRRVIAFV